MSPEDVVLVFRFKNEEENIIRYLTNNMQFCSCFVAIDDDSTLNVAYELFYRHPKCAAIVKKFRHAGYNELCDREALYSLAITTGKKFVLYLDLDEAMDKAFLQEMYTLPDRDIYMAPILHLYPDENHYIIGGVYAQRTLCFMAKLRDNIHFERTSEPRLHQRRFPMGTNESNHIVTSPIYHYGMSNEKRRIRRLNFYLEHDPYGEYQESYSHLMETHRYAPIEVNIDDQPAS